MTVSANPTPDLQRDQIIACACGLCGIIPMGGYPEPEMIDRGSVHFTMALLDLQAEGIVLTSAVRTTLALVSGTAEYTLETDTIDVELGQNDAIGTIIPAETGAAETIVRTMSRGEWMDIATKSTMTGRPSRCFIDKAGNTLKAVFWPVPDSSLISFRYTKVRLLRGNDTRSSTIELRRTWIPFLTRAVASGVAFDNSMVEKADYFRRWAKETFDRYKAGDVQHGSIRLTVGHSGRNW
jgi:hypothetical protein